MSNPRRLAALLLAVVATMGGTVLSPVALRSPADARGRTTSVTMSVLSVSPSTPAISSTGRPLTITISLENTSGAPLTGVTVTAERGDPISSQTALDLSLTNRTARTDGRSITPVTAPKISLAPGVPVTTTFTTTTSIENGSRICLCATAAVYPIDLTARVTSGGAEQVLGGTRTYLPVFDVQPTHKIGVAWVWPLIDRPHRTTDGNVFTDDDLATSVATGGRLDRALQVVEDVTTDVTDPVPVTLVVDPDLLDELQIMSTGRYSIRAGDGTLAPGTGQQAAAEWLSRLRAVLDTGSGVDIEFTPLADPDVTGLTRHGDTWSADLSPAIAARVTAALGGARVPTHTFAWPPGDSATVDTLDQLVSDGADTVLLDGARVRPSTSAGIPVSTADVRTSTGSVKVLLTSPALQSYTRSLLAGSTAVLPELVSELAVRVAQRPDAVQSAVLAAPRYVDVQAPDTTAAAIRATSTSVFSEPVNAASGVGQQSGPTSRSTLRSPSSGSANLSGDQLAAIGTVTGYLPAVTSLIGGPGGSAAGRSIVSQLPDAIQRSESAAWSRAGEQDTVGGGPAAGATRATDLATQLRGYLSQVRILNRSSSSYTLASSNSPLPISVRNDSPLSMQVVVTVSTVGGLPGFATRQIGPVRVDAHSKATFKIRTKIQRSGRILVKAELYTPDNTALGDPVRLFVHSTVLGTIGVVITIVAGVILALALLVRYVRRVLRLRGKRAAAGSPRRAEREQVR